MTNPFLMGILHKEWKAKNSKELKIIENPLNFPTNPIH